MEDTSHRAIAIVGAGAVLPDASNVATFWQNIKTGRNCITEVSPDRWNPDYYFDTDHSAPDKTYSKIGGWVREFSWEPLKWRLPIPPRVAEAMDESQKWAIACTREALEDYGYPNRPLDVDRTAVILGNAMAGEKHYLTSMRVYFPEYAHQLDECPAFASLPKSLQADIARELRGRIAKRLPEITEDSMPGELANCLAGRIANLYNFHGPNFTADAACASTMAAMAAAVNGLVQRDFDSAVVGGIDRNMGAPTFVKFCKIGALSATGTRPYAEGADGFVMGEGAAIFILKRLADAERDGDKIYAVLRGVGGSSDGKGKGITAPNPVGQRFAIERAWQNAGLSPATATFMEGHGTSTRVGDVVEVQSITDVLGSFKLPASSVALGSVKSNIGHLKGAAGAAATLKIALSLRDKILPPSVNCTRTNPDIDFVHSPLYVNTELKDWTVPQDGIRRAGLSAFGFGGTNFHMVMEEYIPHRLNGDGKHAVSVGALSGLANKAIEGVTNKVAGDTAKAGVAQASVLRSAQPNALRKAPLRGALVIGADSVAELTERLRPIQQAAAAGQAPPVAAPAEAELLSPERLSIDYGDAAELAEKAGKVLKALATNLPAVWTILRAQGIFRGHGPAPKVAFLYTGQGSQYVNMIQALRAAEPVVAQTFAEADHVLTPLLSKPLSEFIFIDGTDEKAVAQAEDDLRQTAITQPAVIATDVAITRLLAAYGIQPDMAMGHSVGEYGALVASGALPFEDAMEAVSARGREMTHVALGDNGGMVAVFAPLGQIKQTLKTIDGYVVIANVNSKSQAVIGGESKAIKSATEAFLKAGFNAVPLPVSHAFHTAIVAGASEPLKRMLERLRLQAPRLPIIANLNGEFYPTGADAKQQMVEMLAKQVASPVQFVKGLETLYAAGARVFVETGPKKALQGFAEDVLREHGDVVSLFTNHPKLGDAVAFNQALCGLYAAGLGAAQPAMTCEAAARAEAAQPDSPIDAVHSVSPAVEVSSGSLPPAASEGATKDGSNKVEPEHFARSTNSSVVITGAALGLPGTERIFDDANVGRILRGERFIDVIPASVRRAMLDKHITRLVKDDNGGAFETIDSIQDVIKLAGRGGAFDVESEFGVSADRAAALDRVTCLAIASGIDALRDAGIPLVMRYKTTTIGTQLADRWMLPEALRDDTGVICASAFPGYNYFAEELSRYHEDRMRRAQLAMLGSLKIKASEVNGHSALGEEIAHRFEELQIAVEKNPYNFDRRFLFKALSMGHSQLAEFIGARGPNTQINSACASTPQAVALAEDWIQAGRCRRVIIVSADDVTSDHMLEWIGAGFLASGAAATDELVEEAAIPFDRRRHGMVVGMGAGALIVESAEAVRERGIQPICEVLSTVTANSAFHGTRLDVKHIAKLMEDLIAQAEVHKGISRREIAPKTVFVSHETYTPARGGSAAAEIHALRHVFGDAADQIVIANTKGFTGHAMATGIEDVVAVKALETGCVPPVANFKEVDPELGPLNLSKGGAYPVEYALRLAAGFGSQISMTLLRWVTTKDGVRPAQDALGYAYRVADADTWKSWLGKISGNPVATLEVVHRTLRVCDVQAPRALAAAAHSQPATAPQTPAPKLPLRATPTSAAVHTPEVHNLTAQTQAPPVNAPRIYAIAEPGLELHPPMSSAAAPRMSITAEVLMAPVNLKPELVAGVAIGNAGSTPLKPATPVAMPRPATTLSAEPSGPMKEEVMDAIKEKVLDIVAEKTGYPKDMLDLDLDLEADLGVDTVKQAEMFAAVRAAYNIPRDETVKLRDFPTLAHVIRFAHDRSVQAAAPADAAAPQAAIQAEAPAPTPAAVSVSDESIKEKVLEIVAEKTGYPKDMLDLDLDLEADLGVDTVKQAEMFAAVRAAYNIPRDENVKLRDFPTLAHVIRFAHDRSAQATAPASVSAAAPLAAIQAEAPAPTPAAVTVSDESIKEKVLDIVAEKTGYPKDMLDLDLDLEADLGVDTVKQAEMFAAVRAAYNIPRDENVKLRDFPTLAHVIRFAHDRSAQATAPASVSAAAPQAAIQAEGPAPTPAAVTDESIKEKVLEIVAEKTGYPKDMLDVDLDLEADLGVDTVKQAEMFAAVRAAYNIPRDENVKLRDFPTLAHVIRFAHGRVALSGSPINAPNNVPQKEAQSVAAPAAAHLAPAKIARPRTPLASFEATNSIPRRVPIPILRPALEICKPTGVTLGPGSRVVLMPDNTGVADAMTKRLQAIGVEVLRIDGAPDAGALIACLKNWIAMGPIQGVYWLAGLDQGTSLRLMDLPGWREALRVRVKLLYTTMRALYEQIAAPGTFLVSATLLGGQHGYDEAGAVAPLGGPVVGMTKTYKRERTEVLVKSVDFELGCDSPEIADVLIDETLRDPGAVEIGYKEGERWTIGLQEQSAADGEPGLTLDSNSVFVVTGAAGGIVSAITADLAAASGGTFYLLDLVPEPNPDNPDLARFASDKDGLKRELFGRIQARGERATPALVEKELTALERAQAALNAINAVRDAGGTAHYFSVNLTDAEGVSRVIEEIRQQSGRIDVLLHAAGMERSHFLPDKDPREFDLIFDVKCDGWFNLLHAIGDMPLAATVAFSSIAGRFGNGGQADYSSANDLLCKITSSFRTTRPGTRGIAIDWTAWGGIGMATRGSIPKMMELAGIDMLPPEAGVPLIRRELTAGGTKGEVVVAQRLGIMLEEWDTTGGLDIAAVAAAAEKLDRGPVTRSPVTRGPMIGKILSMGVHSGLTIETTLDPALQPFLHDHQIGGTPVLPGVMGIEAFAEAAQVMLPGWHVETVEGINFLAPFKFYKNQPRTLTIKATISQEADAVVADCRLIGHRNLPSGPEETVHFTASVRLTKQAVEELATKRFPAANGSSFKAADIYRIYFHGPAYRVLNRAWQDGNCIVGELAKDLPIHHQPSGSPVLLAPRLIELCFQTAGLWEIDKESRMGLPRHVGRVCWRRNPELASGSLYAVVTPHPEHASFDAAVVDAKGTLYLEVCGYTTVALPDSIDGDLLTALRAHEHSLTAAD
jgi:acyl transferase domain-containing protein/NAD(P)-dependent dehydrogenase (short-subunit alcohol dehydrogenase family)/acyl carrier protein